MSDIQEGASTNTPAPADSAAAPVSAPVITETPAAAPAVKTPAAEPVTTETPAPAEAPKADEAKPDAATNVLGDTGKPDAVKDAPKADAKPEGDKPADKDAPKADTPPEAPVAPVYEAFKLPENYTADKESLEGFNKILGEIESGKLDHAGMQEKGQALIDLGTKAITDSIERLNDYYVGLHEKQKSDWFESFKKDPELGGDKVDITVSAVRDSIDNYGGTAEQVKEFRALMKETGIGNNPAVIRLINNMKAKIDSYTTEKDNGNGGSNRIVPGQRPAPSKVKPYQQFYNGGAA